jgi:hypothetical protein
VDEFQEKEVKRRSSAHWKKISMKNHPMAAPYSLPVGFPYHFVGLIDEETLILNGDLTMDTQL